MEKVVVAITTYNLKEYIRQALDSVLMQKTTFPFKILIADDASTDGTVDILEEYRQRYPDKIQLLTAEKNMGSLANSNRIFHKLRSEYFTFLDGDDYWVGEDRLQRQVDFLDAHPEYMMCAGNTQYLVDNKPDKLLLQPADTGKAYSFRDMLEDKMPFVHTSAILVRNTIFIDGLPGCYFDAVGTFEECALRGEDFRRVLHLEKGPLYLMPELVSVYRIHAKGVWQGSSVTHRMIEGAIGMHFYAKYFADTYAAAFAQKAQKAYKSMMTHLVVKEQLLDGCDLEQRDITLLSGLLADMRQQGESAKRRPYGKLKRGAMRLFLKLIKFLP